jgi:hypothetical protein
LRVQQLGRDARGIGFGGGCSRRERFSDDLSVQFDSGQEFFVQWRQRLGADFLTTDYSPGDGWKQVIIGEGSRPGQPVYSCTTLEVVTVNI